MKAGRFTPPPLDGALSQAAPNDPDTVESMAKVLVEHEALAVERDAIRVLSSTGFGYGAIVRLADRAQARARALARGS
jgi:hypothetical protein